MVTPIDSAFLILEHEGLDARRAESSGVHIASDLSWMAPVIFSHVEAACTLSADLSNIVYAALNRFDTVSSVEMKPSITRNAFSVD